MNDTTHSDSRPNSRRDFLVKAGATSAAAVIATSFVGRAAAQPVATSYLTSKDPSTDPLFVSATKLAQMIRNKQITAVEAVTRCYARIDQVNPKINAVVAFCRERALAEAKLADESLAAGKILGPLHGVPFTIKDSFDTEGVVSTGGTLGRKDFIPGKDATIVARVRKAGAILLGKTNTPEFTLGGGARGTYNLVYGQTYNPYKEHYNPSGSSGGAGAIVAAGGAYFDLGSDYGGSIRGPAFNNGIAGIKPTYGRTPRTGHIVDYGGPFDNFQETGPLARRVEDLYLLLSIIGGPDNLDAAMAPVPLGDPGKVDLKKLRIAYYTTDGFNKENDPTAQIQDLVKKTVGYFSDLGAKVTEDRPPQMKELADTRKKYSDADGGDHMRRLLKKHGTTQASPGLNVGDGTELPSADFTRLLEEMDAIKSEQLSWFAQYDLIICPAAKEPAQIVPPEFKRKQGAGGGGYTSEYNTTGWPGGVVRVGASADGLPIGVQVVGQPWRDDVVIAALSHIESKTGGWQKPPI
ncbi:MAG: amidase [Nevskia sp.]|nr:amidase [Nevskia sp.]